MQETAHNCVMLTNQSHKKGQVLQQMLLDLVEEWVMLKEEALI